MNDFHTLLVIIGKLILPFPADGLKFFFYFDGLHFIFNSILSSYFEPLKKKRSCV